MRNINFSLIKEDLVLQEQKNCYAGEHLASQFKIFLPENFDYASGYTYVLQFQTADLRRPRFIVSADSGGCINFPLPNSVMVCGQLNFQLEVSKMLETGETEIVKVAKGSINVEPSIMTGDVTDPKYISELHSIEEAYKNSKLTLEEALRNVQIILSEHLHDAQDQLETSLQMIEESLSNIRDEILSELHQKQQNGEFDGQSATIGIGNVEQLPSGSLPYVYNAGTSVNAVLNFGIPRSKQTTVNYINADENDNISLDAYNVGAVSAGFAAGGMPFTIPSGFITGGQMVFSVFAQGKTAVKNNEYIPAKENLVVRNQKGQQVQSIAIPGIHEWDSVTVTRRPEYSFDSPDETPNGLVVNCHTQALNLLSISAEDWEISQKSGYCEFAAKNIFTGIVGYPEAPFIISKAIEVTRPGVLIPANGQYMLSVTSQGKLALRRGGTFNGTVSHFISEISQFDTNILYRKLNNGRSITPIELPLEEGHTLYFKTEEGFESFSLTSSHFRKSDVSFSSIQPPEYQGNTVSVAKLADQNGCKIPANAISEYASVPADRKILSRGINFLSEFETGELNQQNGKPAENSLSVRSKYSVKVGRSKKYYINNLDSDVLQDSIRIFEYDQGRNFINSFLLNGSGFVTGPNTDFIKLSISGITKPPGTVKVMLGRSVCDSYALPEEAVPVLEYGQQTGNARLKLFKGGEVVSLDGTSTAFNIRMENSAEKTEYGSPFTLPNFTPYGTVDESVPKISIAGATLNGIHSKATLYSYPAGNCYDYNALGLTSNNPSSITIKKLQNGWIHSFKTAWSLHYVDDTAITELKPNTTYTLTVETQSDIGTAMEQLHVYKEDGSSLSKTYLTYPLGRAISFISPADGKVKFRFHIAVAATFATDIKFRPTLTQGNLTKPYTPYAPPLSYNLPELPAGETFVIEPSEFYCCRGGWIDVKNNGRPDPAVTAQVKEVFRFITKDTLLDNVASYTRTIDGNNYQLNHLRQYKVSVSRGSSSKITERFYQGGVSQISETQANVGVSGTLTAGDVVLIEGR